MLWCGGAWAVGRSGRGAMEWGWVTRLPSPQIIERCSAEVGRMKQTEELIRLTQRLRFHKVKVGSCPAPTFPFQPPMLQQARMSPCSLTGPASGVLVQAPGVAGGADRVRVPEGGCALHLAPPLHPPLPAALQRLAPHHSAQEVGPGGGGTQAGVGRRGPAGPLFSL